MREHIKDIPIEEIRNYENAVLAGIYEFGASRKPGKVGLYQIHMNESESKLPKKESGF